MPQPVYWSGHIGKKDDFGDEITNEIIDAATKAGPWAIMTPASWKRHGRFSSLGHGYGQRFVKQEDDKWLKVKG